MLISIFALQGHVVAEEQLEVPEAWLPKPRQPAANPDNSTPGALKASRQQKGAAEVLVIEGPQGLLVEVGATILSRISL